MLKTIILSIALLFYAEGFSQSLYVTNNGSTSFTSDAPLEVIKASSKNVIGALKVSDKSFAFSVMVNTFEGFNSSLQRTHFNENYLESDKYPKITFEGKIIEDINIQKQGTYSIRGKGKFTVHGVTQERIIPCKLIISSEKITVTSSFSVFLADHNIKIPSVVNQKIAEEITVSIKIEMVVKK